MGVCDAIVYVHNFGSVTASKRTRSSDSQHHLFSPEDDENRLGWVPHPDAAVQLLIPHKCFNC